MLKSTIDIIEAVAKNDPSATPEDVKAIVMAARNPAASQPAKPLFVHISEAAKMLGLDRRSITNFIEEGILKAVKVPGRNRRLGVTYESIEKFITTAQVEK